MGHALTPWVRRTFSATRICSAREAVVGEPTPPLDAQVAVLNCRPPKWPLPVLAFQLPPDSHCATASQFMVSARADAPDSALVMAPMARASAPMRTTKRKTLTVVSRSAVLMIMLRSFPDRLTRGPLGRVAQLAWRSHVVSRVTHFTRYRRGRGSLPGCDGQQRKLR